MELQQIKETLMSQEFKNYVDDCTIKAIILMDGTVSLVIDGVVCTDYIPLERK